MRDGSFQFRPSIADIGEEAGERGIGIPSALDEVRRTVMVLAVGGMDQGVEQVAGRVGRDVTLAPHFDCLPAAVAQDKLDFLAGIIAA